MTVHEIFTSLNNRMIGAVMIHTQLNQIFTFVDLLPDAKRQEQQLLEEMHGMVELNKYYLQHHHALLISDNPPQIDILHFKSSLKKSNDELSPKDKMHIIQYGMREWIEWERGSKVVYEDAYKNLMEISEVASADFVLRYVNDVNRELKDAELLFRVRDGINWDLPTIYDKQARLRKG